MEHSQVTVATITWARSAREEAVLRRSLARLAESRLRVAVADAGNKPAFRAALDRLPGFSVTRPGQPGLVSQIKASIALAAESGTPFVLYTEPDKEVFFDGLVQHFLRRVPNNAGVVLASRSAESFNSFPRIQRFTEGIINDLCADFVGPVGDYSYGPFLVSRALLPVIARLPADLGWGWRPSVFLAARRLGLRVSLVTGDYPCPPDQRGDEDDDERAHRLRQLSENIAGLAL